MSYSVFKRVAASFASAFLLLAALFFFSGAKALEFSLTPAHFGNALEFWYQKPRPELLKPMLAALNRAGLLRQPEKQLFLAAFFSRLLAKGQLQPQDLLDWTEHLGEGGARMAAWSLHLAGLDLQARDAHLLKDQDALLHRQIQSTPATLSEWRLGEPAIVDMFMAAFMADGDGLWLDKIIDCVLMDYDNRRDAMKRKTAAAAAATLYEYGSRHPAILQALKRHGGQSGHQEILEQLIKHSELGGS